MRIDLHTHSTASDGADSPAVLIEAARVAGLDVVALTDHDNLDGHAEAAAATLARPGLSLVRGVEISCLVDGISLHMLGYLIDPDDAALRAELDLLRTDRFRRARAMVEKLVALGAPVSWEQVSRIAGSGAVGRPHVARALVDSGVVADIPSAFVPEWIGSGGRAYVEKYSLTPTRAIELVKAAGGVSVFAHPAASSRGDVVTRAHIDEFAAAGLDGIEVDHPDHNADARTLLRDVAKGLGLLVTGSSDYHGSVKSTPIGAETTDPAVFEEIVARAGGAAVIRA